MKSFKKVMALTLVAAMTAGLTACGETGNSNSGKTAATTSATTVAAANPSETQNPVTIRTVSMFGGTDSKAGKYQEINEQLMKEYSYITIEDDSQSSSQEWKTKIAADFSIGNEPDVIMYFTDANASDVLLADKFVTLDEIKSVYPDYAKDILPAALGAVTNPDGVKRAVPTTGYWEGLYCNKDLFDEYNLELPTDWEKLLKAIEVFQEHDIIPIAVSLNEVPHYWVEFLLLASAGQEDYEQVPTEVPESWVAGLDTIKTLRDLGAFPVDTDTIDNNMAGTLFFEKKAAMQLDGSWFLGQVTDQENTVLCQFPIIPDGKAEPGAMVGGISSGFYITKRAWNDPDKREAAVKFVMAHTNRDAIQAYWNGNGQAASAVEPIDGMTDLAISGLNYSSSATSISAPTDSRITQEAYNTLIKGIVGISKGTIDTKTLLEEVIKVNAK